MRAASPSASHADVIFVVGPLVFAPRAMQKLVAAGFALERVEGVHEAQRLWTEHSPAAILVAPGDGHDPFETVRLLRVDERSAFVPIFVLAVHHAGLRISAGVAAGADDVFQGSRDHEDAADRMVARIARARELAQFSILDPLTALYNRRFINDRVPAEVARAARGGTKLAVVLVDLDEFKRVNDRVGHTAGDRALVAFAHALRSGVRGYDIVCRFGGDEFVALFPDCSAEGARAVLRHLRARRTWTRADTPRFTFSAGVAQFPDDGTTWGALFEEADRNLRAAKARGRNVTCASRSTEPPPDARAKLQPVEDT